MLIYLLYVLSPIIVYLIMGVIFQGNINKNLRLRKLYLYLCGLIMALMIGLRHQNVGTGDSEFYYANWERLSQYSLSQIWFSLTEIDLEPGYLLTTWALSKMLPWGQWAFITSGLFFAWAVCTFVHKNARNVALALFVFNCLGLFNFEVQGLRQAFAMSICLFALEQCKNRNLLKFLFIVFIACCFHASAIVFSIVYAFACLKINTKSLVAFSIMAIVGVCSMSYALTFMNLIMNEHYTMNEGSEQGGIVAIFISTAIVIFGLIFRDRESSYYSTFIYMTIVVASVMLARALVLSNAERIGHYFAFGQMIVVANSVSLVRSRILRITGTTIATLLCFIVAKHKASYSILIPYNFYWEFGVHTRHR